jgi:hypothetical protein
VFPLLLSAALAQPAVSLHAPAEPVCRVLARGDGYVVHAVPAGARAPGIDTGSGPFGFGFLNSRTAILHTDLKTGRMKKLVEGGEWSVPGPPMGIDRVTHRTLTIASAATGPDRLYVLVMHSTVHAIVQGTRGPVDRTRAQLQHVLYVFRLADGSTVQELKLPEPKERLAGFHTDSVGGDLIRVTRETVTVGVARYLIRDRLTPFEEEGAPPAKDADGDSRVLTRGDGHVVHAVRVGPHAPSTGADDPRGRGRAFPNGLRYSILHTDTKTGRQRKLAEGGTWTVMLPDMAVNRSIDHAVTILAATADRDRVYVLTVRKTVVHEFLGATARKREHPPQRVLSVFRLADGNSVQEIVLPAPHEPVTAPERDTLDPALIRVTPTSVRVGTAEYHIGERLELVEAKP